MSLITNEIHILDGFKKTVLVFAADRRISKLDGSFGGTHPKLFPVPYFDGGISYFGLAEVVFPSGRHLHFSDFVPAFINKQSGVRDLKDFAFRLRGELNKNIPESVLKTSPSGFHICGYRQDGIPEFWFLANIGGMDEFNYVNLQQRYTEPSPDLLGRDAVTRRVEVGGIASKALIADQQGHGVDVNQNVYTMTSVECRLEAVESLTELVN